MKRKTVYLLGLVMILIGIISTFQFIFVFQELFQNHLNRYSKLFERGLVTRCLYLDVMMFLYMISMLFKNFYYVVGVVCILYLIEFGRELGLLASFISLVTDVSSLMYWGGGSKFLGEGPFLNFIGILISLIFIYFLTRGSMVECFRSRR